MICMAKKNKTAETNIDVYDFINSCVDNEQRIVLIY